MPAPIPEPLRLGAIFHDRYQVIRIIESGGMGTVYEVLDRRTQRQRALKTMHPNLVVDRDLRERFHFEATATAVVKSDHIVEVLDAGIDQESSRPYLVMELLHGENLGALLEKQGVLAADFVVLCLWQVALALDKTHKAGIVHRDLKPDNLYLTQRDDGSPHVKILDFGIAKIIAQSSGANTTRNVGTPYYMSPEQIRGSGTIDGRADLYALGHVAFTLLTGKPYWKPEAESLQGTIPLFARVLQGGITESATVRAKRFGTPLPTDFDRWFLRATAYDPCGRYSSATRLVEELSSALGVTLPRRDSSLASSLDQAPRYSYSGSAGRLGSTLAPHLGGPSSRSKHARNRLNWRLVMYIGASIILLLAVAAGLTQSRRVSQSAAAISNAARAVSTVTPLQEPSRPMPVAQAPSAVVLASATTKQPADGSTSSPNGKDRTKPRATRASESRAGSGRAVPVAKPDRDPTDER